MILAKLQEITLNVANEDVYGDHIIFREGKPSPSNFRPRPKDKGFLSFRDSLSNPCTCWERPVFRPDEPYMHIDTTKLPTGSVVWDNDPPGHVSVLGVSEETFQKAVVKRGNGKTIE